MAAIAQEDIVQTFRGMSEDDQASLLTSLVSVMSVMSTVKAVKKMEEDFGVSAAAPVMAAAPAGAAAPAAQEKTEFAVVMSSFGENKVGVIKVVREATGLGLKEAKDLVEKVPATIKEGLNKEDAEKLAKALTEAGAKAETK